MRALCLSAALLAVSMSAASAQTAAPAAAAPLTPAEIKALQAKLSSLDREMGREWLLITRRRLPNASAAELNDIVARAVRDGSLVIMRPLSPTHEALQIERAEVEAKLLAAGQKVRNMSKHAQQQYGVKQPQLR